MKEIVSKAIFGSFDGMTCILGVIAAGYIIGDTHALVLSAVGLALASGISMTGGAYLSDVTNVNTVKYALVIGVASCIGILLPSLPFAFAPKPLALLLCALITCALGVLIAQARVSSLGILKAYGQTFLIIGAAAGVSIAVTTALNKV